MFINILKNEKIIPFYMIYLSCQDNPTNSKSNNPELDTKKPI